MPARDDPERRLRARVVGQELRRLRWSRGWSQAILGGRAGVSQSTVSRLENGLVPDASIDVVVRMLAALDAGRGVELTLRFVRAPDPYRPDHPWA
jgi:transcriptional regulator with XRE-family HTH domain